MWPQRVIFSCGVLVALFALSWGHIYEEQIPGQLRDCLKFMEKKSNIQRTTTSSVDYMCINKFLYQTPDMRWKPDIKPDINPILQRDLKICKKTLGLGRTKSKRVEYTKRSIRNHLKDKLRQKRQASAKVTRKEYRMMTNAERARFHRAIQMLKADRSVQPNLYDAICNLHPNIQAPNAHYGPAFLGYHRVLLWFFEKQLQRKVPGVFLPYWDSTKDGLMPNPTASVLFSSHFAGTGHGVVRDGPFANFNHAATGILVRNLEAGGGLMTRKMVVDVVRQTRTEDMITPFADSENNLEMSHAMVHAWIGGTLDNLNYSPADPLFWMHHCYVDYIWELQRQNARNSGRNPDTDYPRMDGGHSAEATMLPFTNLKNKDGFDSGWVNTYYGYQHAPVRCRNDGQCKSAYYKCFRGNCISRTVGEVYGGRGTVNQQWNFRKRRSAEGVKEAKKYKKTFNTAVNNYFPNLDKMSDKSGTYYKFKHTDNIPVKAYVPKEEPKPEVPTKTQDLSFEDVDLQRTGLYHSFQNTYTLDGVEDNRNWVYLPVMVYYQRPAEVKYEAHPIRNGKVLSDTDVYSSTRADKYRLGKPGRTATSSTCKHIGSGAFKVYVKAYGINYDGVFTDYAVVDERQPLSFALTQVGVKNPRFKNATTYITAYDSCGRLCKARCLIPGSNPARFKPCSGTIRVTPDTPLMYSSDIADAHLHTYNYESIPPCLSYDKVFLVFYCDQSETWPWEQSSGSSSASGYGAEQGFARRNYGAGASGNRRGYPGSNYGRGQGYVPFSAAGAGLRYAPPTFVAGGKEYQQYK